LIISCAQNSKEVQAETFATRREVFAVGAAAAALLASSDAKPALAAYGSSVGSSGDDGDASAGGQKKFVTFYGAASPPATYGYIGGTTKDKAKYSYDVPIDWKEEAPSKVEKGAGGQDSRFVPLDGRGKVKAFCLTLNRAGQDGAAFELTKQALSAISGADSAFQDAITTGNISSSPSSKYGQDYLEYDIEGPQHYAVSLTIDNTGRLFAFLITAPDRTWEQNKATYKTMLESFRTYLSESQFV